MVVFPEKKFAFCHVPKTGGSSIRQMYYKCGGIARKPLADGHLSIAEFLERYPEWAEFEIFAVKRNPWDRLASAYRQNIGRTQHRECSKVPLYRVVRDFEAPGTWGHRLYTATTTFRPQWHFTEHPASANVTLLPFEDFENTALHMARKFKLNVTEVKRENVSPQIPCLWDERALEIFSRLYRRDIEELGYGFEGETV